MLINIQVLATLMLTINYIYTNGEVYSNQTFKLKYGIIFITEALNI